MSVSSTNTVSDLASKSMWPDDTHIVVPAGRKTDHDGRVDDCDAQGWFTELIWRCPTNEGV